MLNLIENKIKKRLYLREWRKKNKEKYKAYNYKHQKTYLKKNKEKIIEYRKKYKKIRNHCLFCNKSYLVRNSQRHRNSKIHTKNVNNFNIIFKNKKKLLNKIIKI